MEPLAFPQHAVRRARLLFERPRTFLCLAGLLAHCFAVSGWSQGFGGIFERADAVIVGSTVSVTDGAGFSTASIRVTRSLKGSVGATVVVEVPPSSSSPSYRRRLPVECGLWILGPGSGGRFRTLMTKTLHPYFPLPSCESAPLLSASPSATVATRVTAEVLEAAVRFEGKRGYDTELFRVILAAEPGFQLQAATRLENTSSTDLRAIGLAVRIANQDLAALQRFEREVTLFAASRARGALATSIRVYRNSAPVGAHVLGRLAGVPSGPSAYAAQPAAEVLRRLHSKETLPYLVQLLDSPDRVIREDAVAAITYFRLGIPSGLEGRELDLAIDHALNPATTRVTAEERPNMHLGRFSDQAQEASVIQGHKTWWLRTRAALGL